MNGVSLFLQSFFSNIPHPIIAIVGGILPALVWLWFWLREDNEKPEPRRFIALAFLAGFLVVIPVIFAEVFVAGIITSQTLTLIAWAAIEEFMKFGAAYLTVLRRRANDEPIDAIVYMITVALGFAGFENILFLWNPALSGHLLSQLIVTGDLRSVGANLLHVLASATIGGALALSFYKPHWIRRWYALFGLILAITLHATFNLVILNTPGDEILRTFSFVWLGLLVLLAFIEFVKRMRPRRV